MTHLRSIEVPLPRAACRAERARGSSAKAVPEPRLGQVRVQHVPLVEIRTGIPGDGGQQLVVTVGAGLARYRRLAEAEDPVAVRPRVRPAAPFLESLVGEAGQETRRLLCQLVVDVHALAPEADETFVRFRRSHSHVHQAAVVHRQAIGAPQPVRPARRESRTRNPVPVPGVRQAAVVQGDALVGRDCHPLRALVPEVTQPAAVGQIRLGRAPPFPLVRGRDGE